MLKSLRVAGLLVLALFGLAVAASSPAWAHDQLIRSNPADGATVTAPPEVTLSYSAKILPTGARVQIDAPDGSHAAYGAPSVNGKDVAQKVEATAPGRYQVTWRVTSSDGHPISGRFSFIVKEGPQKSSATPAATATDGDTSTGRTTTPEPTNPKATTEAAAEPASTNGSSTSPGLWIGIALAVLFVVLSGGALHRRNRSRGGSRPA